MKTIRYHGYQTTAYTIDQSDTHWVFAEGSSIQADLFPASLEESSDQSGNIIDINGLIRGFPNNSAINISGTGTQVNIGAHGVTGAINLDGTDVSLTNFGRINGVRRVAIGVDDATVVNHGVIVGVDTAIGSVNLSLVNGADGLIRGGFTGIFSGAVFDTDVLTLTNHGTIRGDETAIRVGAGRAVIHNNGIIDGDISLAGGGSDVIDNRGGIVHGTVAGGLGDDIYTVSSADIQLLEKPDEGYDTVRSTVTYTLQADFEQLQLLGTSDINGSGNAASNDITGNSGNNRLSGGKGEDFIDGRLGDDRLTGGGGADVFIFQVHFDHDVITDFADGVDRMLLWRIEDVSDFKELKRDHLSVSGDGLLIHYGDDSLLIRHMTLAEFDISDIRFAIS